MYNTYFSVHTLHILPKILISLQPRALKFPKNTAEC